MQFDHSDDAARIQSLHALAILDTPAEERFDRLTRLASWTFRVPVALVSLVDRDRQWFKSWVGLDAPETPRPVAFCSHAVEQRTLLVVPDATCDARAATIPWSLARPASVFTLGQPIFARDGAAVGTLCIIDTKPRAERGRTHPPGRPGYPGPG
ncbi:GAF domain-containing protein [Massilia sp. B-10]|nr:GAF domain-containing protein [Massilia sp. B-10]